MQEYKWRSREDGGDGICGQDSRYGVGEGGCGGGRGGGRCFRGECGGIEGYLRPGFKIMYGMK